MANDPMPPVRVQVGAHDVQSYLDSQDRTPKSAEEIGKLSPAARLDYARKFNQNQMPAWKDPRTPTKNHWR